ncbi:MAG: hypothetical protein R3C03_05495 [Pirellulaceae bacterium]
MIDEAQEIDQRIEAAIYLADRGEALLREMDAVDEQESSLLRGRLIGWYKVILERGNANDPTNSNAIVAHIRIAEHSLALSQLQTARENIDALLGNLPDDPRVMLLNARLLEVDTKRELALEEYSTIAAGSPIGSELWLEAKLGQVRCLSRDDSHKAQLVAKQVLELVPDIADRWRIPFEAFIKNDAGEGEGDGSGA